MTRQETAEDFVERHLIRRLGIRMLAVGGNFACGRGRRADDEICRAQGFRHLIGRARFQMRRWRRLFDVKCPTGTIVKGAISARRETSIR